MSALMLSLGDIPLLILLVALVGGFAAGYLANLAADRLPRGAAAESMGARRLWRRRALPAVLIGLFLLLALHYPGEPARLFVSWCYAWFFSTVLVIDLETRRVLNVMLAPAALFAIGAGLWLGDPSLPGMLGGALVALLLFGGLYLLGRLLFGRGALGLGDVKLAVVIGLITGYPAVMQALLLGAVLGAVAAMYLLVTRRAGLKSTTAYAPYLAVGAMLALWTTWGG